jgi:catechol 2,3-dioxygenase-like lactoylglutathione lyase family enzyme
MAEHKPSVRMTNDGLIVFLGTKDLEATHRFYHGVLGLALDRDQGVCRIYGVPGGGGLGFREHLEVSASANSPVITLLADDVEAVHARLLAHGVSPEAPPKVNTRFAIYHFFVRDPNGYAVEVQRFRS